MTLKYPSHSNRITKTHFHLYESFFFFFLFFLLLYLSSFVCIIPKSYCLMSSIQYFFKINEHVNILFTLLNLKRNMKLCMHLLLDLDLKCFFNWLTEIGVMEQYNLIKKESNRLKQAKNNMNYAFVCVDRDNVL